MPNTYDIGDLVRLSASFAVNGTPTDPTTIAVKVKDPSGNIDTETNPTKDDTGDYHHDISADEKGVWYYRWEGTGAAEAAEEAWFTVRASQF